MKFLAFRNNRKRLTAVLLAIAMIVTSLQIPDGVAYAAEAADSSIEDERDILEQAAETDGDNQTEKMTASAMTETVTAEETTAEETMVEETTASTVSEEEAVIEETAIEETEIEETEIEETTAEEAVANDTAENSTDVDPYGFPNLEQTYKALDDTDLSSKANGKPKVLIFYFATITTARNTMKSVSGSMDDFGGADIYAIECERKSRTEVESFRTQFANRSTKILFSYDDEGTVNYPAMLAYTAAAGIESGTSFEQPVICYIDSENKFQLLTTGESSAEDVLANLHKYCGYSWNYKITYELDGGQNNSENPETYSSGTETIILKDATKENAVFDGWYTDAKFNTRITEIAKGSIGGITLYAKWKPIKYDIPNLKQTYTALDGTKLSSTAAGKPKVLIFFRYDQTNCGKTMESISGYIDDFDGVDIYAIECNKGTKEQVSKFQKNYGSDEIAFAYDEYGTINKPGMEAYEYRATDENKSTYPLICYIDANDRFQLMTVGESSAQDIKDNLKEYCDYVVKERIYNITYELDGGTNDSGNPNTYTRYTETITLKDAVKIGAVFEGWYKDAQYSEKVTKIPKGSKGDITLYAKWSVKLYNLANLEQEYTALDGTKLSSRADGRPKILIFYFHNNPASGNTIKSISDSINDFDGVDLYAIECNQDSKDNVSAYQKQYGCSKILFAYDEAGTVNYYGMSDYTAAIGIPAGTEMMLPVICYIDGENKFQLLTQGESSAHDALANLQEYCGYSAENAVYKIIYELDGGTNNSENPATYTSKTATIVLKDPVKGGCLFEGWYKDAQYSEKVTKIPKGSKGDITLYAKWNVEKYNLANPDVTFTAIDGTKLKSKAEGKPKVLIFYENEAAGSKNTIQSISSSIDDFDGVDIYAIECSMAKKSSVSKFQKDYGCDRILFSYDEEGTTNLNGTSPYLTVADIPEGTGISMPLICYIDADNKFQLMTDGESSAEDVLINLQYYCDHVYNKDKVYKITYKLNGGKNDDSNPKTYTSGTETIVLKDPVKEGYQFGGWYKDAQYSERVTEIPKGSTGDITLYAKWGVQGYDLANLNQTYTALDGTKLNSRVDDKPKVLIFYINNSTKTACKNTMKSIRDNIGDFSGVDIYAIECNKGTKDEVGTFQSTYGSSKIPFAYDTAGTVNKPGMQAYELLATGKNVSTYTYPLICYIDADNRFQMLTTGESSAEDMMDNLRDYCGYAPESNNEAEIEVTFMDKPFIYNGQEQEPEIRVTTMGSGGNTITLKKRTDYNLSYKNNKNAGTATVIVTGIGKYTGTVEENFVIEPAPLTIRAVDTVILIGDEIPTEYEYEIDGLYGTDELIKEPAYTCSITNTAKEGEYTITLSDADAGSNYAITYEDGSLTVKKPYSGPSYDENDRIDITGVKAATIKPKVYDGHAYEPAVKLTITEAGKNKTLIEGADYTVKYTDNIDVGKGHAVITGTGLYKGTITLNFEIQAKSIKKLKVIAGSMSVGEDTAYIPIYIYDGTRLLKKGYDYYLLKTENITKKESRGAEITITGIGNYSEETTAKIAVYDAAPSNIINPSNVTLKHDKMPYTGKAIKDNEPVVTIGGKTLDKKNYKVQYKNNKDAGTAFVIVTGKGAYKGTVVKEFTIYAEKCNFEIAPIKANTYNGKLQKPSIKVKSGGKTLKKNKDYVVTYMNNLYTGTATVKVSGIGNYKGSTGKLTFAIKEQKVSKVSVKGTKNGGLTLTYAGRKLKEGRDYTLSYGEEKNNKVMVTITAVDGSDFVESVTKNVKVQ